MAKRVNVRFLTILTAVVVPLALLVAASPFIYSKLLHHNPKHWIALGDAAVAKQDWKSGVNDFGTALTLDATNKSVCVSLGDCWYHLTSLDRQNLAKAIASWKQALEIDPQYVPALQRLLGLYQELANMPPTRPELFGQIRETARRLAQADPSNADAKAAVDIATIQQWLANGPVSDQDFQHSLAALQSMLQHDPANPNLMYYLARANILQGTKALKQGDSSDSADNYEKQAITLVDSALAIKPDDPALNLRAFQVYAELSVSAHLTTDRDTAAKSAATAIANAAAHATPGDSSYPEIVELYAQWEIHHGKNAEAEAILRKYDSQFPDDLRARIYFATSLAGSFGKRDEAIALLSKPIVDNLEPGPKGEAHRGLKIAVLSVLTGLEVDKCDTTADPDDRQKLLAKIVPQIDQLMAISPDDPRTLRMKGAVEAMEGQRYQAIETLSKAKNILEASTERDGQTYFYVLYQLGGAFMSENQSASAEKALEQASQIAPDYVPVHQKLAALYLQDHNFDQASLHIDAIRRVNPKDPNLSRLQLALDQMNQQRTDIVKGDYDKLPEVTRVDRLVKAQAAASLGNLPEVARLVQLALDEKPNDPQNSLALADVQHRLGHDDQAIAVLQAQLKLSPNDDRVALSLKQLQHASPEALKPYEERLGGNEFARTIAQFGQDFNNRNYDAAQSDLKKADLLGSNEQLVDELYFQLYVARQQYDEAAGVASTLGRLNADDADGLTYQVRLAMVRNHRDEAIRAAQKLTGSRPELAMSWVMLGDAYRANGQYDQALQNYRQALDRQTTNPDAIAGEIACYIALHDDAAWSTIEMARRLYPNNQSFRSAELNYKMTYGNPEEVVAELQKNLDAAPQDPNGYLMLVAACMQTADGRSDGSGDNGPRPFLITAHDVLAKALTKWPNDPQFVPLMAQVEQATGDYASALKLLNDFAALPQWKDRAEPQLFLADLYNRAGETPETEAALRAAWGVNRNNVDVQLRLARFLGANGKYDDALSILTETSDPAVAHQRLEVLIDAGRYPEAETGLQAALAKAPEDSGLLYLLSVLHANTGRFQDAQADVQHGLNVDPKNSSLMLQSARIEMSRPRGDLSLAARQLVSLLQSEPKNLDAHVMLSDLYARQGQVDVAITEMESALKLSPLNKPLRSRLAKLYEANSPPQWVQFDEILHKAEANDQIGSDPTWLDIESTGLFKRNQVPDALAKMKQAVALAPDNSSVERDYIVMLIDARQYDDAVQEVDRVLAKGKRFWWLHDLRGIALAKQNQKQQALQEFQTALADVDADNQRELAAQIIRTIGEQIGPDTALTILQPRIGTDAGWKLLAINLNQSKGDAASVLKLAEDVAADPLSTSTQRFEATQAIATGAEQQGLFDKAKGAYLSWLEQNPKDLIALNNLACLLTDDLKLPRQARDYAKQAYDQEVSSNQSVRPFITDTYAWVLISCGGSDSKLGVSLLQQVVQDHPEFIAARYHLAEAYLQAGDNDDAMTQLSAALDSIKTQEANHVAVPNDLKKNIDQAMNQAKQATTKGEAAVH